MIVNGLEAQPNPVNVGSSLTIKVSAAPYSIISTSDGYIICTSDSFFPMSLDNRVISIFEFPFGDKSQMVMSELIEEGQIGEVYFAIQETEYQLAYDSVENVYKATIQAPSESSWNESRHVYECEVRLYGADEVLVLTSEDFSELALRVRETTPPAITPIFPANNETVRTTKPTVEWTVTDADSGVASSSISMSIDNGQAISYEITKTAIQNGYRCIYALTESLSSGPHVIKFNAADNDGNSAIEQTVSFNVDVVPPSIISVQLIPNPADTGSVFSIRATVSD